MVSLALMERLVAAVRPAGAAGAASGIPGQLASIEAGAVLGDVVGPAARPGAPAPPIAARSPCSSACTGSAATIAPLAAAVRDGDGDGAIALLERGGEDLVWIDRAPTPTRRPRSRCASGPSPPARRCSRPRRPATAPAALAALDGFRILCAHRRGPYGVSTLTARVARLARRGAPGLRSRASASSSAARCWSPRTTPSSGCSTATPASSSPGRADARRPPSSAAARWSRSARRGSAAVDTVYAMTIHKSQGSQFARVAVVLPPPDSRLLTRELLYTALTRATGAAAGDRRRGVGAGRGRAADRARVRSAAAALGVIGRLAAWIRDRGAG